ncbi:glycosyltransferase, partial [Desulfovibrio sp. OttesenSCG-928-A18]|nr:glycosyltransferase [Desulfovibrio sp. OttesenSCG-928-A18]
MHPKYFELFRQGVSGELELLHCADKVAYFERYCDLIMVEGQLACIFFTALSSDQGFEASQEAQQAFVYCLDRGMRAMPLHSGILGLYQKLHPSPERETQLGILKKLDLTEREQQHLYQHRTENRVEDAYDMLLALLRENPAHVGAASALLELDFQYARDADAWTNSFTCPKRLAPLWAQELFLHFARRGIWKRALPLWEKLPLEQHSPYAMVYAADNHLLAGDSGNAIKLYSKALRIDPRLAPVRMRLEELSSPLRPRQELLTTRKTAICLYSWNKGELLEQTLRSLADTDSGKNPIFVLLNGCTDDSQSRVEAARALFPDRDFHIISLPVNVGAPAARNWLFSLPGVQACEYVAYMDDDIILQKDWLARYLTEMEADPGIGVVGCKVVFPPIPGESSAIQYIYRSISLPVAGAFKLTYPTPADGIRDTGLYTFSRRCINVMGCLHLLRASAFRDVGGFDLIFSPSQVDDLDHDLCTCLKGYKVVYCGSVRCEHHQVSGIGAGRGTQRLGSRAYGSIIGNDLKLNYKHAEHMRQLGALADEIL